MERRTPAFAILLSGLLLGIVGYNFFYDQHPGLNVLLFSGLVLVAVIGWSVQNRTALSPRRLWLLLPILFFAAMFAVRANLDLLMLDGLMMLGLGLLFIHYLTRSEHVDEVSTGEQIAAGAHAGIGLSFGALPTIGEAWKGLQNLRDLGNMKSVLRGLLFALPIVIIFGILLSSADLVFAKQVEAIFGFLLPDNLESIVTTVLITGAIAWVCTGILYYALTSHQKSPLMPLNVEAKPSADESSEDDLPPNFESGLESNPRKQKPALFSLNLTESGIILGSVVVLFAGFVMIQFAYLFGGRAMIGENFTFAVYARRGFFELVAVSVLTQGLILALDQITVRRSTGQNLLFRLMGILLTAETFVILASAWRRMSLYEIEYGFTYLRVFTHIFMVWLALLLVFGLLALFRVKKHVFSLGLLLVTMGYLGTLNVLNVDNYIASRNIERFHQGHDLDMCYLNALSMDALPAILDFYNDTPDEAVQFHLRYLLQNWQFSTKQHYSHYTPPLEFNISYRRAYDGLSALSIPANGDWTSCLIESES